MPCGIGPRACHRLSIACRLPWTGTTETSPLPYRDIVVIGASAGGIEALRGFFHALPAGLEAAFLVVLHIPADTPSQLDRVLGHSTQLAVDIAQDGEAIRNGHVYVASADRHLMATAQAGR